MSNLPKRCRTGADNAHNMVLLGLDFLDLGQAGLWYTACPGSTVTVAPAYRSRHRAVTWAGSGTPWKPSRAAVAGSRRETRDTRYLDVFSTMRSVV
jgi:hypothetical protein